MKRDELERQSLGLHRQSLQGVGGWETFRARERSAGNDARSALLAQLGGRAEDGEAPWSSRNSSGTGAT